MDLPVGSLPYLKDEGYVVNKQSFWDLIRIRYGWELSRLPETCECGRKFTKEHALSCKKGGFVSLRHNQVRNITAILLKEVCHDVCIEPRLQKLTGESLNERVANTTDEARLDISARGFWTTGQLAFLDVRVFNPIAKRYVDQELSRTYVMNEKEKKKMYNERVMQIEHGSFTPLVMSATGGMGRECHKFYARLSELIADKRKQSYSFVASWVRRKICFALINSVCICIRGSRSIFRSNLEDSLSVDPEVSETRHAFGDEISLFFNILWFYQSGMNCLSSFVVQFTLFLLYILSILAMHTYAHYSICNLVFYIYS